MENHEFIKTSHFDRKFELFNGNLYAEKIFGDADAKNEWNENSEESSKMFIHTESYEKFKDESLLFLLGRRGTGKTAMIKMLDYEIKNHNIKSYSYSEIFSQDDSFYKLSTTLRSDLFTGLTKQELIYTLKEKWSWIIYSTAMVAVYKSEATNPALQNQLSKVENYLKKNDLLPSKLQIFQKGPFQKAIQTLENEIEAIDYQPAKIFKAIIKTTKALFSTEFEEALECLVDYLKNSNKRCVVLMDSKEVYEYKDKISDAVISSLMETVLDVYSRSFQTNIYSKVAFPSEMYPHFSPTNVGKTIGKTHFIMWRFKDIISFVAKRYHRLLEHSSLLSNSECESNMEKDCYEDAHDFIYCYLPPTIESYNEVVFDTIAYIVKHSQKKPRQIIQLFNIIFSLAKQNNIKFDALTETCIKEGVNIKLELLTSEVYDMYSKIFPDAGEIIRKTFKNTSNIFRLKDVHTLLKDSSQTLAKQSMDREDAERLFLESGLIGIVQNKSKIKSSSKILVEALFEYQVKDTLSINHKDELVLHPMFYQSLHILAEKNSFIYPKPAEDEIEEREHLIIYQ